MLKLYSWNVNGVRAVKNKGEFDRFLETHQPDILGIQETKASPDQLTDDLLKPHGYTSYWSSSVVKKGYSGVALYSKHAPKQVSLGLGIPAYDDEGRTIVAEYEDFVFITAYFPNGSRDHSRVPFKMQYKADFLAYINGWRAKGKPVIFCGDVNTSHQPIDLARPKQNEKTTGFMPEERAWLDKLLGEEGYVDTFRALHPQEVAYSWWSNIGNAREKNIGWRLDYFIVSADVMPRVQSASIHPDVYGSDHCPVSLVLA